VVAIAAGGNHNLALKKNGKVIPWGEDYRNHFSALSNLLSVVSVAAGHYHDLALRSNDVVIAMGLNDSGQTNVPSNLSNVVAIAGGEFHSLALVRDGSPVVMGPPPTARFVSEQRRPSPSSPTEHRL
jgi:alpha-tubulin suppressor-like RCC1 family protein